MPSGPPAPAGSKTPTPVADSSLTGDGEPPRGNPERYFDYGDAVSNATSGTALPMVRTLAQGHGWSATLDTDYEDGVRIVVTWAAPA